MPEKFFSFGKNWKNYAKHALNPARIEEARKSLLEYLPAEEYAGKTFLDIGCGSGVFSLNAVRLGCRKVVSFDVDPHSVATTELIKKRYLPPASKDIEWKIFTGSILDPKIRELAGTADIVYSWGVLHHTGNMTQAIRNAAALVNPKGWFVIAIYNRAPSSENWLRLKRFYNQTNWLIKQIMILSFYAYIFLARIYNNLKRFIRGRPRDPIFSRERGMSIYYDLVDWLGGYPYEFLTFEELRDFVESLGFSLHSAPLKISSIPDSVRTRWSFTGTGNNVLVFKKLDGK